MKLVLILMALALNPPKDEKKVIFKTIPIDRPKETLLIIDNLNGDVSVEPSSDGLVHVYLEILMEANNEQLLSKARKELELGQYVANDSIVLFTKAPFIKKCHWGNGWGYDIRNHPKYAFKYQYKVKVPREMSLEAKTVNNGDVVVQDMDGPVKVCNVNGAVEVKNAKIIKQASTVNGDVTINFLKAPEEAIAFNTVNGDFKFTLPNDFNAKVYFDSMNGDLYTSFDYKKLGARVTKSEKNGTFKIGTKTGIEIGSAGPELSFKSINGNVYLKKSE